METQGDGTTWPVIPVKSSEPAIFLEMFIANSMDSSYMVNWHGAQPKLLRSPVERLSQALVEKRGGRAGVGLALQKITDKLPGIDEFLQIHASVDTHALQHVHDIF